MPQIISPITPKEGVKPVTYDPISNVGGRREGVGVGGGDVSIPRVSGGGGGNHVAYIAEDLISDKTSTSGSTIIPIPPLERREVSQVVNQPTVPTENYAVNLGGGRGVYTSEGKYYPTVSDTWLPSGYKAGTAIYTGGDKFVVAPAGSQGVSTKYGEGYVGADRQITLYSPNEPAIRKDTKEYYDWAAAQKSIKPTTFVDTLKEQEKYYRSIGFKSPTKLQAAATRIGEQLISLSQMPTTAGKYLTKKETPEFVYALGERRGVTAGIIGGKSLEFAGYIIGFAPLASMAIAGSSLKAFGASTPSQRKSNISSAVITGGLLATPLIRPTATKLKPVAVKAYSFFSKGIKNIIPAASKFEKKLISFGEVVSPVKPTAWGYIGKPVGLRIKEAMGTAYPIVKSPSQAAALGYVIAREEIKFTVKESAKQIGRGISKVGTTIIKPVSWTTTKVSQLARPVISFTKDIGRTTSIAGRAITATSRSYTKLGISNLRRAAGTQTRYGFIGAEPTRLRMVAGDLFFGNIRSLTAVRNKVVEPIRRLGKPIISFTKDIGRTTSIMGRTITATTKGYVNLAATNLRSAISGRTNYGFIGAEPTQLRFIAGDLFYGNIRSLTRTGKGIARFGERVITPVISKTKSIFTNIKQAAMEERRLKINEDALIRSAVGEGAYYTKVVTPRIRPSFAEEVKPASVTQAVNKVLGTVEVPTRNGMVLLTQIEEPTIVTGQQSIYRGEYTGRNLYELTGGTGMFTFRGTKEPTTMQVGVFKEPTTVTTILEPIIKIREPTKIQPPKTKVRITEDISGVTRFREDIITDTAFRDELSFKQTDTFKDALKFRQAQQVTEIPLQTFKQRQRYAQKFGEAFQVKLPKLKETKASLFSKVKQAFDVVIFRRGKEERIAAGLPLGKAKALGVKSVLSTLRASFKLKPRGTTTIEDINYILPSSFRLGKYDTMRFVQKKTTRFGTRSETKEAQFFRKVRKGKVNWL